MLFPFIYFFDGIDPDSEVVVFAKRTVKDLKLPPAFITQIAQSIQVSKLWQFCLSFSYIDTFVQDLTKKIFVDLHC